jgi:hypothetical protein
MFSRATFAFALLVPAAAVAATHPAAAPVVISSGWQLQDAAQVSADGAAISTRTFRASHWYPATVPGTVLTTLVNNHVYPEPLYGENDRPEVIPDSLARGSYWYRTTIVVPRAYARKHIWLNFDGINYNATVWLNGFQVGTIRGAFVRGRFDISDHVQPGRTAVLAVLIAPQPHPGEPHEHTIQAGMGRNGGVTALDGPTFLSTIGWDWLPAMRDRDAGIWQKVYLSASGPVTISDPLVTTDLPLPKTDSADVAIQATLTNVSDAAQKGVLHGSFGDVRFEQPVELAAHATQVVKLDATTTPALHMLQPKLWWPNGYGPQNLYQLHLHFDVGAQTSDVNELSFGVRKITYEIPGSDNLTVSVNGVPIFIRGGDWGLDEGMKRIPRERLDVEIHLHQLAHLNLIRNWVGQSTGEDFYELCDKYGILLWDEFFQPNPSDGPNPDDIDTYMANVRDKILRFRNHQSIAIWCARNEGYPPPEIDAALRKLMAQLEPTRLYQPSSTEGRGVHSSGPYYWRAPRIFYKVDAPFKTEIGSMSVPTLESVQSMMPEKDWNSFNDDWAEHDFAKGAARGDQFPAALAARYGAFANLADFVRKAQLADYEAFRAMYEGRNAQLFHPATGVITWMSDPAHPSFVWQIYSYDLEPFASFFAVQHAAEMVHIQFNQETDHVQVINNLPDTVNGAMARVTLYNLDGSLAAQHEYPVTASPDVATDLGAVEFPETISAVNFVKLELTSANGEVISSNVYWHAAKEHEDDFTTLASMPTVTLEPTIVRHDADGRTTLTVTLRNPSTHIALMTHLQLRRASGERVLPVTYSDNYVSLMPGENRTVEIEAAASDMGGKDAVVTVDGWNVGVKPGVARGARVALNINAQVDHWPATGMAFQTTGLR